MVAGIEIEVLVAERSAGLVPLVLHQDFGAVVNLVRSPRRLGVCISYLFRVASKDSNIYCIYSGQTKVTKLLLRTVLPFLSSVPEIDIC